MTNTIIAEPNQKYLSEVLDKLPLGILNKQQTNVGGSYMALNSPENYILVAPTRDLIDNKLAQPNSSEFPLFGVYGGTSRVAFKNYIRNNVLHHILVTYDSLPKLIKWLEALGINAYDYNILYDEYHLLLTEMGYRSRAIETLVRIATRFKHYTFMSATPIIEQFLPQILAELPYTVVKWTNTRNIIPTRFSTHCVYRTTVRLLQDFSNGQLLDGKQVEEFFIFTNSVKGIKQILDTAKLDPEEVKVVCADTIRNSQILDNYEISTMTGENRMYNFFTSKGFQGCDLYSTSGLTIVVSDSKKKHTLTDIQTALYQISGRIRNDDNVFRDKLFHVYSTGYVTLTEEEFLKEKEELINTATQLVDDQNSKTEELRLLYKNRLNIENDFIVFNEETKLYEYSELKQKFYEYNYYLTQHTYKNGLSVRRAYEDANLDSGNEERVANKDSHIELTKRITTVSFKTLFEQYIELREDENSDKDLISRYELEHPIFKDAYEKLGAKVINSCKFNEKAIRDKLYLSTSESTQLIQKLVIQDLDIDRIYTLSEAKQLLAKIYSQLNLKGKPKAKDLEKILTDSPVSPKFTNKMINGKCTEIVKFLK
jgi:hypothetical protein